LILGLIFGSPARFFRSLQEYIDAVVGVRVAILLEMELWDVPQTEPGGQFVTQIMPGVVQSGQGIPLSPVVARQRHLDMGIPAIGAHVDFRDGDFQEARIVQLEPDDFSQLLLNRHGDS
jgi:hypothetical protein